MYLSNKDKSKFLYSKDVINILLKEFHSQNKEQFFQLLNDLFQNTDRENYASYLESVIELLKDLGYQFEHLTYNIDVDVSLGIKYCINPNISLRGNGFYRNVNVEEIEYITFFSDTIYYIKFQMKEDIGILIKLKG